MIKINRWDEWQTFRKDRGTPPWIKLYRNLLSNEEWVSLSDSEKGQLVSIWILAADKSGEIPENPLMIQRMAMLDTKPNINKFIELGFMTSDCQPHDNQVVTVSPQLDAPEKSRAETEEIRVNTPYQLIVDAYHNQLKELSRVVIISDKRKTVIKKLFNYHEDHKQLDWWNKYFDIIKQSDFLMGRVQSNSNHTWTCDFDFIINLNNFVKIIEGKYK
jgi:hypothetical protein